MFNLRKCRNEIITSKKSLPIQLQVKVLKEARLEHSHETSVRELCFVESEGVKGRCRFHSSLLIISCILKLYGHQSSEILHY